MINLLTNANKFTEKGNISIKVNFERKYIGGKKVRFKLEGERPKLN
jgi:signal transduction histidine kinase